MLADPSPPGQPRQVHQQVLDLVLRKGATVIVEAAPGAGKTELAMVLVATAQHLGLRVAAVAPTAAQTFDLVRRLLDGYCLPIELLLARDRVLPSDLAIHPDRVTPGIRWHPDARQRVTVATVAKLQSFVAGLPIDTPTYDLLVVDEAYQVLWSDWAALAHVATQAVFLGDQGQLSPVVKADITPFEAAPFRIHWPVPKELLRRFPTIHQVQLAVTRRLPRDSAELLQPAFYPSLKFSSTVPDDARRLGFRSPGRGDACDAVLDRLAAGETIVGLLLPKRQFPAPVADLEVCAYMAAMVERLLARRAEWIGNRLLNTDDIGCIDPHVASCAALQERLLRLGISPDQVRVTTPERVQGLQHLVSVAHHPLSGRPVDEFHLAPGRFCVALSRHLLGCIVVGRDGIGEALEQHHHDNADRAIGADDMEWHGWSAHQQLWNELDRRGRLLRL